MSCPQQWIVVSGLGTVCPLVSHICLFVPQIEVMHMSPPLKVVDCPAIFVHSPTQTEVIVAQVYMQGHACFFLISVH